MYQLIAIDLDGTLLDSYGEISIENKEAISYAIQKGIEVVLASGRGNRSIETMAMDLGANHYMICGNGANVYDFQKQENIYNRYLEKNKVLQIIKICEENSIYYNVFTENTIITKSLSYNTLFYNEENAKKPEDKRTSIHIVEDVYEYVANTQNTNFLKITICDNYKIIFEHIMKKLRLIKGVDVLEVAHMARKIIKIGTEEKSIEYFYTEVTNQNVDKWNAIEFLIRTLQIPKENVIAIGDNVNDISMIQNAGTGVAMGNSAGYIKENADLVVADNNENGVAEAIYKLIK
ncbi:MAG: Cof-type HAD-IIB family hydrolase [Clostridia bacterium]